MDNDTEDTSDVSGTSTGTVVASVVLSVVITIMVCAALGVATKHVIRRHRERRSAENQAQPSRHRRLFASSPVMAFNSMTSKFSTIDFDDSISTISSGISRPTA